MRGVPLTTPGLLVHLALLSRETVSYLADEQEPIVCLLTGWF